ncbi:MAG: hypothetical protein WD069_12130 [Planctomycetales bacterium]
MSDRNSWKLLAGIVVAAAGLSAAARLSLSQPVPARPPADPQPAAEAREAAVEDRQAVRDKLQKKVTVKFNDTLGEALAELAEQAGVAWRIDRAALEKEGIAIDAPLDGNLGTVTVETALEILLPPWGLTWYIDGEVLHITTEVGAVDVFVTRTYDVRRLLRAMQSRPANGEIAVDELVPTGVADPVNNGIEGFGCVSGWLMQHAIGNQALPDLFFFKPTNSEWLIDAIKNVTDAQWYVVEGVGGSITAYGSALVVRQTPRGHDEVAALLAALTDVTTAEAGANPRLVRPPTYPAQEDEAVRQALERRVDVAWKEKPLDAALTDLFKDSGIRHRIEVVVLEEEGIARDAPVELVQRNIRRRTSLDLALEPLGLVCIVRHGFAVVTTQLRAADAMYSVVYDVRDLLIDENYNPLIDLIENETPGPWYENLSGSIDWLPPGLLVIQHVDENHAEIIRILAELRAKGAVGAKDKPDPDEVVTRLHQAPAFADPGEVAGAIREFVAPESWEGAEAGKLRTVGNVLVVRHKRKIQDQVERFLRDLNAASAKPPVPQMQGGLGGLGGGFYDIGRNGLPSATKPATAAP